MDHESTVCHDFKTDNGTIAPPLPGYLRVVPILFFFSVIGCLLASAFFMWDFKRQEKSKAAFESQKLQEQQAVTTTQASHAEVEQDTKIAEAITRWIRGARPFQPVTVAVARSMTIPTTISEFELVRGKDNPEQIELSLKLNDGNSEQISNTIADLGQKGYQAFQPEEVNTDSILDYSATILHRGTSN